MGNSKSSFMCKDPVWEEYVEQPWRSERTRVLDKLGGLNREPVPRGQSITSKLKLLEGALQKQGKKMRDALLPQLQLSPSALSRQQQQNEIPFLLHTDIRAVQRIQDEDPTSPLALMTNGGVAELVKDFSTFYSVDPSVRAKQAAARQRMLAYAKSSALATRGGLNGSAPLISIRSMNGMPFVWKPKGAKRNGGGADSSQSDVDSTRVAAWRQRIHAARRRVILVVLTIIRLRAGLHHPVRLRRLDSFSFYIPQLLGDDLERFAEEQHRSVAIERDVNRCRADIDSVLALKDIPGYKTTKAAAASVRRSHQRAADASSARASSGPVPVMMMIGSRRSTHSDSGSHTGANSALGYHPSSSVGGGHSANPTPMHYGVRHGLGKARSSITRMPPAVDEPGPRGVSSIQAAFLSALPEDNATSFLSPCPTANAPLVPVIVTPSLAPLQHLRTSMRKSWEDSSGHPTPPPQPVPTTGSTGSGATLHLPPIFRTAASSRTPEAKSMRGPRVSLGGVSSTHVPSIHNPAAPPRASNTQVPDMFYSPDVSPSVTPNRMSYDGNYSGTHQTSSLAGARPGGSSNSSGSIPALTGKGSVSMPPRRSQVTGTLVATASQKVVTTGPRAEARAAEAEKLKGYVAALESETQRQQRSTLMLRMFLNRSNGCWAEAQSWNVPSPASLLDQDLFMGGDQWKVYQADVLRKLRLGQVAIQILCGEDELVLNDGRRAWLWTADPWALVAGCRPGSMPLCERVEGLSLGCRTLSTLVLALIVAVGREAVSSLVLLLHVAEEQCADVAEDLRAHAFYGLQPYNIVITVQRRRQGYCYDSSQRRFVVDETSPSVSLGTGYTLMQCNWVGEAAVMDKEGALVPLLGTVFEMLAERGVEWMISHRCRDLSLLTAEGVLPIQQLAYTIHMRNRMHATASVQVVGSGDSKSLARAMDSVILHQHHKHSSDGGDTSGNLHSTVADVKMSELSSPAMVEVLNQVRSDSRGELQVGLQRYIYHVPSLQAQLVSMSTFRPKLVLQGSAVHLAVEAADITTHLRARCFALTARLPPTILINAQDVECLTPLLQSQDSDPAMRLLAMGPRLGGKCTPLHTIIAPISMPHSHAHKPGQCIVVCIADNDVTQMAVNLMHLMARPGRDLVHFLHVVPTAMQHSTGLALVSKYCTQMSASGVEVVANVVVKGYGGLLDCMERYCQGVGANVVVMGSAALTQGNLNSAASMGSVTLSFLKRSSASNLAIIILTANSKNIPMTHKKSTFKVMSVIEPHARPVLNYLCSHCMDPLRGDHLTLAQVFLTRQMTTQQALQQRRVMDNFNDLSASHHMPSASRMQLSGQWESVVRGAVVTEETHLVGVQMSTATKGVTGQMLQLVRSSRAAVLCYRDRL